MDREYPGTMTRVELNRQILRVLQDAGFVLSDQYFDGRRGYDKLSNRQFIQNSNELDLNRTFVVEMNVENSNEERDRLTESLRETVNVRLLHFLPPHEQQDGWFIAYSDEEKVREVLLLKTNFPLCRVRHVRSTHLPVAEYNYLITEVIFNIYHQVRV